VIARRGALLLVVASALVALSPTPSGAQPDRRLEVFEVPHASFEELMALPNVARLAHAGGAALMTLDPAHPFLVSDVVRRLALAPNAGGAVFDVPPGGRGRASALTAADAEIGRSVRAVSDGETIVTVVVVSTSSSAAMTRNKDDLHPVVLASGIDLLAAAGRADTLTSDSTRRAGVVTEADLAPTVAATFGARLPGWHDGFPMRVVGQPAPFDLHQRYLAMRRMTVPVQTTAALYVTLGGLFGLAVLAAGRRWPAALGVIASGIAISVGPLAAALLAAGHLPTLSYATVVPFVVVVTLVLVALVLLGATRDLLHPVLPLAVVLLAFLLVEALLGWTAALTPFLGGSELDGGRFYGLPNVFIGLLLGASLYAAARLPAVAGFTILVAAGLFAGLPFAGANLGGAATLFAAGGLWLPLRARGRLGWRELAFAAAVVVAGTALVLVAHRLSPLPTHVTRFEETKGVGGALPTFVDRLGVGWRLIVRNPFALVPVVGVLATLAVVLRPPGPMRASLVRHRAWRDALLVILLGSVVAYVVNDSGPAACGVGFGMALGGLVYVSVSERTWKMAPA
jgi:hypothetical protein